MKKFIIKGFCFISIGLALLFALNHIYIRTNGYKSLDHTFSFYLMPDNIEVANVGSSHGELGLNYSEIDGIVGFNFALAGQDFYYDLKILEEYRNRLCEDCVVVIPISYFSFVQQKDFKDHRRMYYRILDYGSVQNHTMIEYINLRLLPVLSASFNIKYLIRDKKVIKFDLPFSMLGTDEEKFKLSAQKSFEYYLEIQGEDDYEEYNLKNLEETIEFCEKEGLKPVLITMPFTKYYNERFSEQFYRDFYAIIEGMSEKCSVPYYDYSHDPRFTEALKLFVNSDHLNQPGAAAFTRILLTDLGLI